MNKDNYDFLSIQTKWRDIWEKNKIYKTNILSEKEKYYILDMYPYPSGVGLHVGHIKGYTASDINARYKRLNGFEVLHPMGWDAFGLPTENFAIKTGKDPYLVTKENITEFKKEISNMALSIDWEREIDTSNKYYYKFTQLLFIKLYNKGLAYKKKSPINWCPSCKTVLSNEQSMNGICERCESKVEIKNIDQWFFKITDYAEKLLEGINNVDWPISIKKMQEKWIGKSEGVEIPFAIKDSKEILTVFTTKPETIYGITFLVLAPESPLIESLTTADNKELVEKYIKNISPQKEVERKKDVKTGVFTGSYAINPINNELIPVWIADYVLMEYGTGTVMGVPAHDKRDLLFAQIHNLKIEFVLEEDKNNYIESRMIVSKYKDKKVKEVRDSIIDEIKDSKRVVNYKLRDWTISRERFWGAPIPVVYCDKCGEVILEEKDLPVLLPQDITDYVPTGIPPLEKSEKFMHTTCPKCKGPALRESKTMDTFVDSSWYYLRFIDPLNEDNIGKKEYLDKWMNVDLYIGGSEHAVGHLLYSRFITKFLFDEGILDTEEPFQKLKTVGLIYGEDHRKMSKRWGNVVKVSFVTEEYGADSVRMYIMFMGPFDQYAYWNTKSLIGIKRLLNRIWALQSKIKTKSSNTENVLTDNLVRKITDYIDKGKYNLCVSEYMKYINEIEKKNCIGKSNFEKFLIILSPFAPYITEELWNRLGNDFSIHQSKWPSSKKEEQHQKYINIPIQINGKLRGNIITLYDSSEKEILELIEKDTKLNQRISNIEIDKIIFIKNKILNIVSA